MAYSYGHLISPKNTASGVADFILLAPITAFAANGIKCPVAPFNAVGDEVTIKDAHIFLSSPAQGFTKVLLAPEKNSLDIKTIGDKGFKKFDIDIMTMVPGLYPEVAEAVKNWNNQPHIVLIPDANCGTGQWYQVGCDCVYAYAEITGKTGTTRDGNKGFEVKWNVCTDTLLFYKPQTTSGSPAVTTFINPLTQLKP